MLRRSPNSVKKGSFRGLHLDRQAFYLFEIKLKVTYPSVGNLDLVASSLGEASLDKAWAFLAVDSVAAYEGEGAYSFLCL